MRIKTAQILKRSVVLGSIIIIIVIDQRNGFKRAAAPAADRALGGEPEGRDHELSLARQRAPGWPSQVTLRTWQQPRTPGFHILRLWGYKKPGFPSFGCPSSDPAQAVILLLLHD